MSQVDPVPESDEAVKATSNGAAATNGALATLESTANLPAMNWPMGFPAKPEILSAKPNPPELFHAVRRRWTLALGIGAPVAIVAAAIVWFVLPVRYEAFSLLKVQGKPPSVLKGGGEGGEEFSVFKRTQVQLILSSLVLTRTVGETHISKLTTMQEHKDDPSSWLKSQLIIDYPDDSEILRVAMKGTKREDLTKIVDEVVKKYQSEIVQRERDLRLEHERKLADAYNEYSREYTDAMRALHELEQVNKTSSTEAAQMQKRLAIDQLEEAIQARNRLKSQIKENDMIAMLLVARKNRPQGAGMPDYLLELELAKDAGVASSTQRIAMYSEALAEAAGRSTKSDTPTIRGLRMQMERLEENLEERKAMLRPRLHEMYAATSNSSNPMLNGMTHEELVQQKNYLEESVEKADEDVESAAKQVADIETFSAQVTSKQEELGALRNTVTDLRGTLDRIRVEKLAQERISVLDKATLSSPSGDAMRKYVAVMFTAVFSFGAVVFAVAYIEFQSRKINTVNQVNDGLGVRVVGELPRISGRSWRRMKGGKGPAVLKALIAERMDGTRTALIHATTIHPPRVVMITSAEPREGKTTTATQLAASLARSGRRTLFIDADIRNPGAHRVFEMPQEPGLCELLRGEVDREGVIQPTRTANLWLMPAGQCDLKSVQALSSSYLGTTIAALCLQYEYVIIDAGPVLKVADPLLVGQHCDAAIVSVLRDVSKVPQVYEACERLRAVGITVLGSVVNGVKDDAARHGVELLMTEAN